MIKSYLDNRRLQIDTGVEDTKEIEVSCEIPQGSVLGPTLWNVLYDGLLRTRLPTGVKFLAFADDVALVAKVKDSIQLKQLLTISANRVKDWLSNSGLQLALQKCEAITSTRTHNDMHITIVGSQVTTLESLKYLGLQLDSKWSFLAHAKTVAAKAGKVAQNLSRIIPNISADKSRKRKLLNNVVHSILLYGAPIWAQDMFKTGWSTLLKIQRRICLRIASAYCIVSSDAVGVITCIAPLNLMADESRRIYEHRGNSRIQHTDETLTTWQTR